MVVKVENWVRMKLMDLHTTSLYSISFTASEWKTLENIIIVISDDTFENNTGGGLW